MSNSILELISSWLTKEPSEKKIEKEIIKVEEKIKTEEEIKKPEGRYLWILDNGHGRDTKGKRSPKGPDGKTVLFEYEYNRDIVSRLAFLLTRAGVQNHILVPDLNDMSLKNRVSIANNMKSEIPKIYVSVHGNAGGTKLKNGWYSGHGISTYSFNGSVRSKNLARVFQTSLIRQMNPYEDHPVKDRGIKESGFYVLKFTKMPAVLTENGFFTNKRECYWMLTNKWRHGVAEAHYKAIRAIEESGI